MASIHQEIVIEASPEHVWDAVRDVGAIHERLAPGSSPTRCSRTAAPRAS